jgi:hypothetical protein
MREITTLTARIRGLEAEGTAEIALLYQQRQNFIRAGTLLPTREDDFIHRMSAIFARFEEDASQSYRRREDFITHLLRARRRVYAISYMRRDATANPEQHDRVLHLRASPLSPAELAFIENPIHTNIPTIAQTTGAMLQNTCTEAEVNLDLGTSGDSSGDEYGPGPNDPNILLYYSHRRGGLDDENFKYDKC